MDESISSASEENDFSTNEDLSSEEDVATMSKPSARDELSKMPLGDVMKLREQLGTKKFNMLYHGTTRQAADPGRRKKKVFKRANKNRPAEVSSKVKPGSVREIVKPTEKKARDPRFESASISVPETGAYSFLSDIHKKDQKKFKQALRRERDPEKRKELKRELNRMASQEQTSVARVKEREKKKKLKQEAVQRLREGKKAHFQKKSESRLEALKEQFLELKKRGKLKGYMKRKTKKL